MSEVAIAPRGRNIGLSAAGAAILASGAAFGWIGMLVLGLALLGTPLFAIMGGASELAWLLHHDAAYHHLRFIAPTVLDERFADSPILVTIPLFTFVGYVLAESKTPERLVRASSSILGWLPGGLAIVCVFASAIFTLFTGGSGVTIIAIGGLLYPALRQEGYSDKFALGLVTTGGSVGLLLPLSLPLLVYCLVAGVDINLAFKAVLAPGLLVLLLLSAYSIYVGAKERVPLKKFEAAEVGRAVWALKWELGIPLLLVVGLGSGLTQIDEIAGIVALYTLVIEAFFYKDISVKKDLTRIAKASMGLAGAVIVILAMANALINYIIQESIPAHVLEFMLKLGLDKTWQFLIVMNLFLLVLGMLMDGFSAILVAVPLVLPFAAHFGLGPFHLAIIFILNLEIAFCCPPLGLNLFIASFRFNRPVVSLYRVVLPFAAILAVSLLVVSYVPAISNVLVRSDILLARQKAIALSAPPREAWLLECVQEDRSNPLPCSDADKRAYPNGQLAPAIAPVKKEEVAKPSSNEDDDLMKQMMGAGGGGPATDAGSAIEAGNLSDDDLLKQMMGAGAARDAGATDAAPSLEEKVKSGTGTDDDLMKEMMGAGKPDGG